MVDLNRAWAEAQDAADPLAEQYAQFVRSDGAEVYLAGHSLGMLPTATRDRIARLIADEWGRDRVAGWEHWDALPLMVGDQIGSLIGAAPGQVVVTDSISVNLYKLAVAALEAQPGRKVIVTDASNFPTDRWVLQGAAERRKGQLRQVPADIVDGVTLDDVHTYLADDVALVSFSHVDYRSGTIARVKELTDQAHRAGALVLWDLAQSVGVVPIELDALEVDFAVGCTYKYLNSGPGSPAFLYVRRALHERLNNPIQGWWSAADMFDMDAPYRATNDIARFQTGTPSIPALAAVQASVAMITDVGIDRVRTKSTQLTEYLIALADAWLPSLGFTVVSTRDAERRGGHVALAHDDADRIVRAAAATGVVGDRRQPNLIRLAPSPLSTSFVDVWEGMTRLRDVVASGAHLALPSTR